jgi:hypothetical protein
MPTTHFNNLTEGQAERLAMLAEECNEVAQLVMKILRHGFDSYHPDNPKLDNRELLEKELLDLHSVLFAMETRGDIQSGVPPRPAVRNTWQRKLRYTHHQAA